jgi:hypothetical protein
MDNYLFLLLGLDGDGGIMSKMCERNDDIGCSTFTSRGHLFAVPLRSVSSCEMKIGLRLFAGLRIVEGWRIPCDHVISGSC